MQLLKAFLALGAVTLSAAQNSTFIPPPVVRPLPVIPIIPTNASRPGVQPGKPGYYNGTVVVVVKSYTTWCPGPTIVVVKDKTYTATGPTMLTITNCPCTITTVRTQVLTPKMLDGAHSVNFHPCCPHEVVLTQETATAASKGPAYTSSPSCAADPSESHDGSGKSCSSSICPSPDHASSRCSSSSCPPSSGTPSSHPSASHSSAGRSTSSRSCPRAHVGLSTYGVACDCYWDGSWAR